MKIESYNLNRNSLRRMELEKCKSKINSMTKLLINNVIFLICTLETWRQFF